MQRPPGLTLTRFSDLKHNNIPVVGDISAPPLRELQTRTSPATSFNTQEPGSVNLSQPQKDYYTFERDFYTGLAIRLNADAEKKGNTERWCAALTVEGYTIRSSEPFAASISKILSASSIDSNGVTPTTD